MELKPQMLDEEERRLAVASLVGLPLEDSADRILAAMGDENWRVRKEAVEVLLNGTLFEALLQRLVDMLAEGENAGLRNAASETLERLGKKALPVLCASITSSDHDVRKFVVDILGAIGDCEALPALMPALDDPDSNVAAAVAETIGKIGDPSAAPALLSRLQSSDLCMQFTILEALGRLKSPVPQTAILPLMKNNLLKKAVYDCLGDAGELEAVSLLISGLHEKGRSAREAAIVALVRLHDRLSEREAILVEEQLQSLCGTPVVDHLIASLDSVDDAVKRPLIRLLGLTRDSRSMIPLIKMTQSELLAPDCRRAISDIGGSGVAALIAFFPFAADIEQLNIIQVCSELGYRTCGEMFTEGYASDNPEVREAAIAAVGQLGLAEMVSLPIRALDDSDESVQKRAIRSLVQLSGVAGEVIRNEALRLALSSSPSDRAASAHLLFAVDERQKLSLLLKDEEALVRSVAVSVLSQDHSTEACNALLLALIDEVADVRVAAVRALGESGNLFVTEHLLLLLDDRDSRVQRAVLQSIGLLRDPHATAAVVHFMEKARGSLQIHAMESLVAIAGSAGAPYLEPYLAHTDEEVLKCAINLLALVAPELLLAHQPELLTHPHWEVRICMAKALTDAIGGDARDMLIKAKERETDDHVKAQLALLLDRIM